MKKTFDCVASRDRAAERIDREIKGMSLDEEIAYWKDKSKEVRPKTWNKTKPPRRKRSRGSR